MSSFICESARSDIQIIIISLKEEFYNKVILLRLDRDTLLDVEFSHDLGIFPVI